ncbi:hypothetical protein BJ684DRAFT_14868, partial [Piptocephalis cylindrospora]
MESEKGKSPEGSSSVSWPTTTTTATEATSVIAATTAVAASSAHPTPAALASLPENLFSPEELSFPLGVTMDPGIEGIEAFFQNEVSGMSAGTGMPPVISSAASAPSPTAFFSADLSDHPNFLGGANETAPLLDLPYVHPGEEAFTNFSMALDDDALDSPLGPISPAVPTFTSDSIPSGEARADHSRLSLASPVPSSVQGPSQPLPHSKPDVSQIDIRRTYPSFAPNK